MQVYGSQYVHGPQSIGAPHASRSGATSAEPTSVTPGDEVQFSSAAQLLDRVHDVPDIRADRVAQLRAQIADGTYETPDKLDGALERLLDEFG